MLHPAPLPSRTLFAEDRRWSVERAWPVPGEPMVLAVEVSALPEENSDTVKADTADSGFTAGTDSRTSEATGERYLPRRSRRAGRFWIQEPADKSRYTEHLELYPAETDPDLPALERAARSGIVVAHEPGRRAVVRHTSSPSEGRSPVAHGRSTVVNGRNPVVTGRSTSQDDRGSESTETYTVVRPPGEARNLLDGMRHAQAFAGPFRLPRLIAHDDSTVTFQALKGVSLHRPERFAAEQWHAAWDQALDAWSTAIQHPGELPSTTPVHGAGTEVRRLQRWEEKTRPYIIGAELFQEAVASACSSLEKITEPRMVPSHRELRDEDFLWSPDLGPALLKVSSAGWAHPALDLGSLRACARWNELRGLWDADQARVVTSLINDTAYRTGVALDALGVYERSALLRMSCQYTFSPSLADAAENLRAELVQSQQLR